MTEYVTHFGIIKKFAKSEKCIMIFIVGIGKCCYNVILELRINHDRTIMIDNGDIRYYG